MDDFTFICNFITVKLLNVYTCVDISVWCCDESTYVMGNLFCPSIMDYGTITIHHYNIVIMIVWVLNGSNYITKKTDVKCSIIIYFFLSVLKKLYDFVS